MDALPVACAAVHLGCSDRLKPLWRGDRAGETPQRAGSLAARSWLRSSSKCRRRRCVRLALRSLAVSGCVDGDLQ